MPRPTTVSPAESKAFFLSQFEEMPIRTRLNFAVTFLERGDSEAAYWILEREAGRVLAGGLRNLYQDRS